MQRSTDRILTTHTGSLPRPEALTQLYVKRSRGEPVDEAEIERIGRDAVRGVVARQREAGIDIGNNGEQQRDSFFLYLRSGCPASAEAGRGRPAATSIAIPNSRSCGPGNMAARSASQI